MMKHTLRHLALLQFTTVQLTLLLTLLFVILANPASAQYHPTMRSGRPGQTIGPFSVGKGILQNQSSFQFDGDRTADPTLNAFDLESVFRMGLSAHFELNTGLNYTHRTYRFADDTLDYTTSGVRNWRVGCRYTIRQVEGWKPALGIQLTLQLPVGADAFRPRYAAPSLTGILAQPLGKRFSHNIIGTLGYTGTDPVPSGFYAYALNYSVSNRFSVFVEPYGSYRQNDYLQSIDGGLSVMITDDVQWDLYAGGALDANIKQYFVSTGISWRVRTFGESL